MRANRVVTVHTGKTNNVFLRTNFSDSKPIYFWSKCPERLKKRGALTRTSNLCGTHLLLHTHTHTHTHTHIDTHTHLFFTVSSSCSSSIHDELKWHQAFN